MVAIPGWLRPKALEAKAPNNADGSHAPSDVVDVDLVVVGDGDGDESASPTEFRQHGDNPTEQFQTSSVLALLQCAKTSDDVEHRSRFHRRASCNSIVPSGVSVRGSTCSFGDVERDRKSSASQLISQPAVASWNRRGNIGGESDKLDRTLVNIELLEAEHARLSGATAWRCPLVAVAVAVNDHVNANGKTAEPEGRSDAPRAPVGSRTR